MVQLFPWYSEQEGIAIAGLGEPDHTARERIETEARIFQGFLTIGISYLGSSNIKQQKLRLKQSLRRSTADIHGFILAQRLQARSLRSQFFLDRPSCRHS
jgi:hypothetical protein